MKHTKGKWQTDDYHVFITDGYDTTVMIAECTYDSDIIGLEQVNANAKLISKAPEMYEALKSISNGFYDSEKHKIVSIAKALIEEIESNT